jgi:hypothetical protein
MSLAIQRGNSACALSTLWFTWLQIWHFRYSLLVLLKYTVNVFNEKL